MTNQSDDLHIELQQCNNSGNYDLVKQTTFNKGVM